MQYTQFRFRNFKGIGDLEITLDGDVTTLVGLNESGKTTILEAIFCFSYGSEDLQVINPGLASLRDPELWIPISKRANFNDSICITAVVTLDDKDKISLSRHMKSKFGLSLSSSVDSLEITEKHVFENSRHKKTLRTWDLSIKGTTGRQRIERSFEGNSAEWQGAVAYLKGALPRIWYFPNFLFELPDRFVLTQLEELEVEERDRSTFYRSTFEHVLERQGYGANLSTHIVDRLSSTEKADKKSLEAVLLGMGRAITDTIFEGWNRIFGRDPAAQEVEIHADLESGTAFLELQIKGPDGYYDLSERSLGFRWFFMFLLMTSYSGTAGDSDQRPLFLLDEPASNLHSSAQAELLKSFEDLTQRCHLMYTTHSHHLINLKWLDSAYVVKNEALGSLAVEDYMSLRVAAKTEISATLYRRFVNDNPTETSYFQPVLDRLDYRPSNLEPIPDVVLVEGKSDFYILRYVAEVLDINISTPPLIPGTGAGSLDAIIRLYLGWGKKFIVMLDGDKAGVDQRSRYQELFGPALGERCVLLPDMCADETCIEVESLLAVNDRSKMIDRVYGPSGEKPTAKKALSRSVVELYAKREKIDLSEESVERLRTLGESLTARLEQIG